MSDEYWCCPNCNFCVPIPLTDKGIYDMITHLVTHLYHNLKHQTKSQFTTDYDKGDER